MYGGNAGNNLYNVLMGTINGNNVPTQDRSLSGQLNSLGNMLGTVAAVPLAIHKDRLENALTQQSQQGWKNSIDDVYRKYGFQGKQDYDDQLYAAEDAGDEATVNRLLNMRTMNDELRAQARYNNRQATNKANDYNNWRQYSNVGQQINRGQKGFANDFVNTVIPNIELGGNAGQNYAQMQLGAVNNAAKFNPNTFTGGMVQNATNRLIQNNLANNNYLKPRE